jgi:hypothetical protein
MTRADAATATPFVFKYFEDYKSPTTPILKRRRQPTTLYHYTTVQGLAGVMARKEFWASDIRYLNDASEHSFAWEQAQAFQESIDRKKYPEWDEMWSLISTTRPEYRLFVNSFCERGDSLGQWRAYTDHGAGFAIGIRPRQMWSPARSLRPPCFPCIYDLPTQRALVVAAITGPLAVYDKLHGKPGVDEQELYAETLSTTLAHLLFVCATIKHPSFKEEREWRFITPLAGTRLKAIRTRVSTRMHVPYTPTDLAAPGKTAEVTRIIVGPNPHSALAESAIHDLCREHDIKLGKVVRSAIPFRKL